MGKLTKGSVWWIPIYPSSFFKVKFAQALPIKRIMSVCLCVCPQFHLRYKSKRAVRGRSLVRLFFFGAKRRGNLKYLQYNKEKRYFLCCFLCTYLITIYDLFSFLHGDLKYLFNPE